MSCYKVDDKLLLVVVNCTTLYTFNTCKLKKRMVIHSIKYWYVDWYWHQLSIDLIHGSKLRTINRLCKTQLQFMDICMVLDGLWQHWLHEHTW